MSEARYNPKEEEPNNKSGLGCFFAAILAIFSLFIPILAIWILNLSGFGLKYDLATYFATSFIVGLVTVFLIIFDVMRKNENSNKSNQRQG